VVPIAVGNSKARQEAVAGLANGGRAVFVSVGDRRDWVGFSDLLWRELTLMGSFVMPIGMY
jgi:threonine dehydrogenase-like Zn-dependent dehydrogenase